MGPNRIKTRKHAEKVFRELKINSYPVDLRKILSFYDIEIREFNNNEIKSKGKISAFLDQYYSVIYYNKSHHRHRIRFSIAHEIGHYLMNHKTVAHTHDYSSGNLEELEANMFAAELLMPFKTVKEDLKNKLTIPEMARKYDVSEQAMGIRLSNSDVLLGTK